MFYVTFKFCFLSSLIIKCASKFNHFEQFREFTKARLNKLDFFFLMY